MSFLLLGLVHKASSSVHAAANLCLLLGLCPTKDVAVVISFPALPPFLLHPLTVYLLWMKSSAKSAQQFVSFRPSSGMLLRVPLHQHCLTFYTITTWSHGSNFLCYQNVYFLLPHAVVAITTQLTSNCYVRPGSVVSLHHCGLVPNSLCHTMAPGLHPLRRM